jgi:hypothetical protein
MLVRTGLTAQNRFARTLRAASRSPKGECASHFFRFAARVPDGASRSPKGECASHFFRFAARVPEGAGGSGRPGFTKDPEAAGPGVPAPGAQGPAAGESRRQIVRGTYGSHSCRAVRGSGSVHCRLGLWAAGTSTVRQSGRRTAGRTGGHPAVGGAGSYHGMTPPCLPYYLAVRVRPDYFGPARIILMFSILGTS